MQSTPNKPNANALSKCPPIVADGKYKDFGQVLNKLVDVIEMYGECAARHNTLVDYEVNKK